MRTPSIGAALVIALALAAPSRAGVILLSDGFNGVAIDPAWSLNFENNTSGWTWFLNGHDLVVTDVAPVSYPPGCDVSGASWSDVVLDRSFEPAGDFVCEAQVNWDSVNSFTAMQRIGFSIRDCHGTSLGDISMTDAWVASHGSKSAVLGTQFFNSGPNTVPQAGGAILRLERTGTTWTASFAGTPILTKTVIGVPHTLRITISYYASHVCAGGNTIFGTENIDWIQAVGLPGPQVAGDLNGDVAVNGADITMLLGLWGSADCTADIDESGSVDGADLTALLGEWTG